MVLPDTFPELTKLTRMHALVRDRILLLSGQPPEGIASDKPLYQALAQSLPNEMNDIFWSQRCDYAAYVPAKKLRSAARTSTG